MQYRQGDILLEQCTTIPATATHRADPVLAHGEATGHCHTAEGDVTLYERDGVLYLDVGPAGVTIIHQEHDSLALTVGAWRVTRQREYTPEAIRNVSD